MDQQVPKETRWYCRSVYMVDKFNEVFKDFGIYLTSAVSDWILTQATDPKVDWSTICSDRKFLNVLERRLELHWPCKAWIFIGDLKDAKDVAIRTHKSTMQKLTQKLPSTFVCIADVQQQLPALPENSTTDPQVWVDYTHQTRKQMWDLYRDALCQRLEEWFDQLSHMEQKQGFPRRYTPKCLPQMARKASLLWKKRKQHQQQQQLSQQEANPANGDDGWITQSPEILNQVIGRSWQAYQSLVMDNHALAIPDVIWKRLVQEMKLDMEGFSCVFNSHGGAFCTPFPDLDECFGAVGIFFDIPWHESSYQVIAVDPPYVEEVMAAASQHVIRSLELAEEQKKPLTFLCCYPRWNDAEGFLLLQKHPMLRLQTYMNSVPFEDLQKRQKPISSWYCMLSTSHAPVDQQVSVLSSILSQWQNMSPRPTNEMGKPTSAP